MKLDYAAAAAAAVLVVVAAHAQPQRTFDVASIKLNVSGEHLGTGLAAPQPGGRFIAMGATLRRLIEDAYDMDVVGGPAWLDTDRFDISARADGEPGPGEIRMMLRPLLAERFKLAVHTEAREMSIYALLMARNDRRLGPTLTPSNPKCAEEARQYFPGTAGFPPPCGDFRMGARELTARGMSMPDFGKLLSGRVGRPVVDRTGLSGVFDLQLEWATEAGLLPGPPDHAGANDPPITGGASIFTALQEQLGLRLDATRAPVDVLVVDRAEPPTPD